MNEDLGPLPPFLDYDETMQIAKSEMSDQLMRIRHKHELSPTQYIALLSGHLEFFIDGLMGREREKTGKPVRRNDRSGPHGFTLIELLVVIAIIGLLTLAVLSSGIVGAIQHRQVSEAARILQGGIVGARDQAIRTNRPAGIRLLPDPAFPLHYIIVTLPDGSTTQMIDPAYPLVYNRFIPISVPADYTEGKIMMPPQPGNGGPPIGP